jgi:hypothetical protein
MFDDITYFDGAYYEGKYHTVIKPTSVELLGNYFEEGYITDDYFQENDGGIFSLTATGDTYISRWSDTNRPIDWTFTKGNGAVTDYSFDGTIKKFGSHSLLLPGESGYHFVESDPLFKTAVTPSNVDDYIIEFWFYFTDLDFDIAPLFSMGSASWLNNNSNIDGTATDIFIYARNRRLEATVQTWPNYPTTSTLTTLANNTSTQFSNNTWTKCSLQYTASTKTYKLYINNGLIDTQGVGTGEPNAFTANSSMYLYEGNFDTEDKRYDNVIMRYTANDRSSTTVEYPGSEQDLVYTKFNNNFDDTLTLDVFFDGDLTSTASLTASGLLSVDASANLSSTASATTDATAQFSSAASLTSTATLSATPEKILTGNSTINAAATMSIDAVKIVSANASTPANATLDIDYTRVREFDTEFDAIGSVLAAAGKVGDFFIDMDSQVSLVADGVISVDLGANMSSAFSTTTEGTRIRTGNSSMSASASIQETSTRLRRAASALSVSTDIQVETRSIRSTSVNLDISASLNTIVGKTTGSVVQLDSEFAIQFIGGSLTTGAASFSSAFTQSAKGLIINLDQYVYYIPVETRVNTISSETRSHSVRPEIRAHSVDTETRLQTIRTEDRTFEIKGT